MNWFTIDPMEFRIWLTEKYVEWRGDKVGHNSSVSSFAEYIGTKQQLMSGWMNGDYAPAKANIDKLANKLGYEIYDILNIPQDERPIRADIRAAIRKIPPEYLDEVLLLIEEYTKQHSWYRSNVAGV